MWKATISPEKRKKIKRSVSFFLSLLLILEMVSGTGMFAEGNRVKAKEETPYAVYLDLSGSSTAEALGIQRDGVNSHRLLIHGERVQ